MTTDGDDGVAGGSPSEAFAVLGNDTRVGILLALWDAFESGRHGDALSYSTLFDRVDIADSGNFTYHLEKLTGPFVRRTSGGYALKQTGINVVRAVVAGTVTADPSFGPDRVDVECPICGGPVEVAYADEFLRVCCADCEGRVRWDDESLLFGALVPPAGVRADAVEVVFRTAVTATLHEIATFSDGVCPHCAGPVETTLEACAAHDPGDGTRCPSCDRYDMAAASMGCATCKRTIPPQAGLLALHHPATRAFLHRQGIDHGYATWETVVRSFRVGEDLVSTDPLRVSVTVPAGDDELRLTLDDAARVVDLSQ